MAKRAASKNTSQQHGNDFQYLVMASHLFAGAMNISRTGQESFDVEASCDLAFGLATSIKTAKGDWIGLADAARFCEIDRPWRLLYSKWVQETERIKRYDAIHELIIPLSVTRALIGNLTPQKVLAWHNDIASFAAGKAGAAAARKRAAEIIAEVGDGSMLRLDFKIDDRGQRRLQFSVCFTTLVELLRGRGDYQAKDRSQPHHVVHEGEFHQYPLPIRLISTARVIDRSDSADEPDDAIMFDDAPAMTATASIHEILGGPAHAESLRRTPPVRREERDRKRRAAVDTRQTSLFG